MAEMDNSLDHDVDPQGGSVLPPPSSELERSSRMWMTSMKIFSPLINALATEPMERYSPSDLTLRLFGLMQSIGRLASRITRHLSETGQFDAADPAQNWVLRQIIPLAAETVVKQWQAHGVVDDEVLLKAYQLIITSIATGEMSFNAERLQVDAAVLESCQFEGRYIRLNAKEAISVSQLNALQPLVSEVLEFACWQSTPSDLMLSLSSVLNECTEYLYHQQGDEDMEPRSRLVLLQACMKHAGDQLLSSYRAIAKALLNEYNKVPLEGREVWVGKLLAKGGVTHIANAVARDTIERLRMLNQAAIVGHDSIDSLLKRVEPRQGGGGL